MDQQLELDLGRDDRRQFDQERTRDRSQEEIEPRGRERHGARLRERADRDLRVGGIEHALGRQSDDDVGDVDLGRRCEAFRILSACLCHPLRPDEGSLEEPPDGVRRTFRQDSVDRVERVWWGRTSRLEVIEARRGHEGVRRWCGAAE